MREYFNKKKRMLSNLLTIVKILSNNFGEQILTIIAKMENQMDISH
jgi:hypothetical protein